MYSNILQAFKFGGVYCNSDNTLPFNLTNLTPTRVTVDFDLSKHMDFHLSFPEDEVDSKLPILIQRNMSCNCIATVHSAFNSQVDVTAI